MSTSLSRRELLVGTAAALGAAAVGAAAPSAVRAAERKKEEDGASFGFCLNTSTIRGNTIAGKKLTLVQEIEIAAKAGYDGIEPWLRKIAAHKDSGGSLRDVKKRCADHGLRIPSAIGFARWIVDDPGERAKGLEQAKRDMDLVKQIGGARIAAPPAGATRGKKLDLFAAADRYAKLLEVGSQIGVVPQVELWGFSLNLSRLGETAFVAIEAGHPDACILPDVYHIYKGGSSSAGLKLLGRQAVHCIHLNDYPADPPRKTIRDSHRVYPGDGIAPLDRILGDLAANHSRCMLSLEVFNRDYWRQDPLTVARTGLRKSKAAVKKAFAG